MSLVKCPRCKQKLDGSRRCSNCGTNIEQLEKIFCKDCDGILNKCPKCGYDITEEMKFCSECGFEIGKMKRAICNCCSIEYIKCSESESIILETERSCIKEELYTDEEIIEEHNTLKKHLDGTCTFVAHTIQDTHPFTLTLTDEDDKNYKEVYHIHPSSISDVQDYLLKLCNERSNNVPAVILEETEDISNIDFRSFVIRCDFFYIQCRKQNHILEEIKAVAYVQPPSGDRKMVSVDAYYCHTCKLYYIEDENFEIITRTGRPMFQSFTQADYIKYINTHTGYGDLALKSKLKIAGYSVGKNDGLTAYQRQMILIYVIESGVMTKGDVMSHLDFYIELNETRGDREDAVEKWKEDLRFLNTYEPGKKRYVGIRAVKVL